MTVGAHHRAAALLVTSDLTEEGGRSKRRKQESIKYLLLLYFHHEQAVFISICLFVTEVGQVTIKSQVQALESKQASHPFLRLSVSPKTSYNALYIYQIECQNNHLCGCFTQTVDAF